MIEDIRREIAEHESNAIHRERGYEPLFVASPTARIVIVGQAPGRLAQESGMPWNDASGRRLVQWLGIDEATFRDESLIAHIPMDFYYPGKGKSGDLPPRKEFAPLWHDRLLAAMPDAELFVLIGQYSQKRYLPHIRPYQLTEVVRGYQQYLPRYFPIVHPSPLNFRWLKQNPWFETEVVPALQARVRKVLGGE